MPSIPVQAALDAILAAGGRVTTPLRATHREGLLQLLEALSERLPAWDRSIMPIIGASDLIAMYEATLQGGESRGRNIAENIVRKYDKQLNPFAQVSYEPEPGYMQQLLGEAKRTMRPESGRYTPPPPPPSNDKYALKTELESMRADLRRDTSTLRSSVTADMRAAADKLRDDTTATLVKLSEAIPEAVKYHTLEALKGLTPVTLTVTPPLAAPIPLGIVHRKTPQIIKMLAAGVNVYLHGPAGSGKTTVGRKCAEAFDLPFYFAAKVESEYMLLGFKDARGETVRTQFREAYEHGGVFLFDELDGSSPSAVVALNAALANGICPFPDGIIHRHENFKCIGAGNTKLGGASRQYVGRAQLDAASIDRFAFVEFGYDDALETALATNANWCRYVQSARKAVADRALPHLITPRATYDGCKLLEAGLTWHEVADAVLWKGLDPDTVEALTNAMDEKAPAEPAAAPSIVAI